jgi:dCMP deaminase
MAEDERNAVTRPTWDEVWLQAAAVVAERSLCSRAHVGAVITDVSHRIIATGYNNPPANFDHNGLPCAHWCPRVRKGSDLDREYDDCYALHAEANALMAADRSTWQGGTIYVLGDLCFSCTKLVANSGLKTVVVKTDPGREYRNAAASYRFLRSLGIKVTIL